MFFIRGVFYRSPVLRFFSSKRELNTNSQSLAMEKPTLYGDLASPPVRFAVMTASHLGIDLNFHNIDLFRGEHKSDFYTKINPLQKVPALKVGDEVIKDSAAIALYFCEISKNTDFYPDDPLARAKIHDLMFFNAGSLFPLDNAIFVAYFAGVWPISDLHVKQWNAHLDHLENILKKNKWLAGEKMTLCDLCCASTLSSVGVILPTDEQHIEVNKWLENIKSLPFYEKSKEGLERLKSFTDKLKNTK